MKHIVIDARNRRSSTGRYTDRLIEHLQSVDTDNKYTILIQSTDTWEPKSKNFSTQASDFPQFSFNLLNDFRFAKQITDLKPDLVHFTMTQQPLTYGGKSVTTTHDLTMLRFIRAGQTAKPLFLLKKLGYKLLFYLAHRKTSHVIAISEFVAEDLTTHYPFTKDKVTVIYESSEPPISAKATPLKGVKKPFIMHVGSPFPHKNIQNLILAFEEIKATHPNLELVLAGKKEFYFTELEEWAKTRASYKSIHFTGFIDDTELKWLYQNAEAYVLPSMSEGFGLPGLEAMSHDCPLVSSNATCLPEIYGEKAAHYFDPYNLNDIVRATNEVLSDKTLRESLVKAGKEQLALYSWRTMAEQTHELYEATL